jgi:hypothetical protein
MHFDVLFIWVLKFPCLNRYFSLYSSYLFTHKWNCSPACKRFLENAATLRIVSLSSSFVQTVWFNFLNAHSHQSHKTQFCLRILSQHPETILLIKVVHICFCHVWSLKSVNKLFLFCNRPNILSILAAFVSVFKDEVKACWKKYSIFWNRHIQSRVKSLNTVHSAVITFPI